MIFSDNMQVKNDNNNTGKWSDIHLYIFCDDEKKNCDFLTSKRPTRQSGTDAG